MNRPRWHGAPVILFWAVLWLLGACGTSPAHPHVVLAQTPTATATLVVPTAIPLLPTPTDPCVVALAPSTVLAHGIVLPIGLIPQEIAEAPVNHFAGMQCSAAYMAFFLQTLPLAGWALQAPNQQSPHQYVVRCERGGVQVIMTIIDYDPPPGAYVVIAAVA